MTKPFRDLKLAKKEGKTLTPEDLSSKDLGTSLLENMVPDAEFRAIVEKSIQDAIRVGTEIGKLLDDVKPMSRVMIAKTIYEHTLHTDKKMVQLIKKSGLWESI
jgi:hypothetical protein